MNNLQKKYTVKIFVLNYIFSSQDEKPFLNVRQESTIN